MTVKKNELTELRKSKQKVKLKKNVETRIIICGEKFPENRQRLDQLLERVNSGREKPTAHYDDFLNYALDTFSYSDTHELIEATEDHGIYVRLLWEDEISKGNSKLSFMNWVYENIAINSGSNA